MGLGSVLIKFTPSLSLTLKQSGMADDYKISPREYLALCFLMSSLVFIFVSMLVYLPFKMTGKGNTSIGIVSGAIVAGSMYFGLMMYPQMVVGRRVKEIERNLLFALRSILIQIRSGVPIFNTLVSISAGDYGPISTEFKNVIERVRTGTSVVDALEDLAVRNPSLYFRRAIWQLVNSMKSGSDVGNNLSDVIRSLSEEQLVEIRRYKSILNPLAMMYMMVAVIIPSLGITMLIILSSFPGMEAIGNEQTFWVLLVGVIFMQIVFMGLVKSKRPTLIGG